MRSNETGRFEGWYFKHQTEGQTVAVIPARHIDEDGRRSASLQVVTDDMSACVQFPYEAFEVSRNTLSIRLGSNRFSLRGVEVDIQTDDLQVKGELRYRAIKMPKYDIMGPFRYLPMQCRHSVISLRHSVSGELAVNGKYISFENGLGYIEGDSGRSFPSRYMWTQCCTNTDTPASIMLSIADIPLGKLRFTGIIGFIYAEGREYRIATYLGAKPIQISSNSAIVRQGKWLLGVQQLGTKPMLLNAPVHGGMTRLIRESAACRARYTLLENGRAIFDFVTNRAGFECEYGDP